MSEVEITMLVIWSAIFAIALVIEFLSYDLVSLWFAPAAIPGMIMAPLGVGIYWQIPVFVVLSITMILAFRPLLKKSLIKETVQTDITSSNFGTKTRLTSNTLDGLATISVNDVTWTAQIIDGADLKEGTLVEITGSKSNKFIVKEVK